MSDPVARSVLLAAGLYLGIGLLFAIPFLGSGVTRIDAAARGSSLGFRLVLLPGVSALWPLLAARWLRGATAAPQEEDAHVAAARGAKR